MPLHWRSHCVWPQAIKAGGSRTIYARPPLQEIEAVPSWFLEDQCWHDLGSVFKFNRPPSESKHSFRAAFLHASQSCPGLFPRSFTPWTIWWAWRLSTAWKRTDKCDIFLQGIYVVTFFGLASWSDFAKFGPHCVLSCFQFPDAFAWFLPRQDELSQWFPNGCYAWRLQHAVQIVPVPVQRARALWIGSSCIPRAWRRSSQLGSHKWMTKVWLRGSLIWRHWWPCCRRRRRITWPVSSWWTATQGANCNRLRSVQHWYICQKGFPSGRYCKDCKRKRAGERNRLVRAPVQDVD